MPTFLGCLINKNVINQNEEKEKKNTRQSEWTISVTINVTVLLCYLGGAILSPIK